MANQQYDQVPALIEAGMNWERVSIFALLYDSKADFDPTNQRASEVGQWLKREPLQGRFIDDDGNFCGHPAVFYMVLPEQEYVLVLGYDDGRHDELLLGYYDTNTEGTPIEVQRRGSLFVRPLSEDEGEAPAYNIWLRPGQA